MSKHNDDIDPKNYYGLVLNLPEDDKRLETFREQRAERGFDDTETWSLDVTIARFIAPRLDRYLEVAEQMIVISEEQQQNIKDLSEALSFYGSDESFSQLEKRSEALEKIRKLFPLVFNGGLWW
jgi:hypothetical protein